MTPHPIPTARPAKAVNPDWYESAVVAGWRIGPNNEVDNVDAERKDVSTQRNPARTHLDCGVSFISPPAKPDRRLGNESRSTNPDRGAVGYKLGGLSVNHRLAKFQRSFANKPDRRLCDERRSTPIQFASRRLLPRWQIGSCCTSHRLPYRLRGFRPLSAVVIGRFDHLSSRKSNSHPHLVSFPDRVSQTDQSRKEIGDVRKTVGEFRSV